MRFPHFRFPHLLLNDNGPNSYDYDAIKVGGEDESQDQVRNFTIVAFRSGTLLRDFVYNTVASLLIPSPCFLSLQVVGLALAQGQPHYWNVRDHVVQRRCALGQHRRRFTNGQPCAWPSAVS
jgi:hypothetical protein